MHVYIETHLLQHKQTVSFLHVLETLTYPVAKESDTPAVARFDVKQAIQQCTVQCSAVLQCRGRCTVAKPKPQ